MHKGKLWPVENGLRIFTLYEQWPEWIPRVGLLTASNWAHVGVDPGTITAEPTIGFTWAPGSDHYEFRTAVIPVAGHTVELGWQGKVGPKRDRILTIIQAWWDGVPVFQYGGPNVFEIVTWSNWGPTFPVLNKVPAANTWPRSIGCEVQFWP